MYPTTFKSLWLFVSVFLILNFFNVEGSYGQVPPPPPPGGSELWSGTSTYEVDTGTPDENGKCYECYGVENPLGLINGCYQRVGLFNWVEIGFTEVPCSGSVTSSWTSSELESVLNNFGFNSLPGGFNNYTSIVGGIRSGALYFDRDDWDVLISYAQGTGNLQEACDLAYLFGSYIPSACVDLVPIPFLLQFLLLISLILIFYRIYYLERLF